MDDFTVSARKYRPATFDSVVEQKHITETLKNAIKNNHLAQSFLFCGPRGVGKTTCARILAKAINCSNLTSNTEPCNQCGSCQSFNNNASLNIYELDAASNNSVEDIRNLIEQVRYTPQGGKYKVYIIDEVHMLSQNAFNAFLKTLEEPPSYAIFILATTEKNKIIPTILSRCQIFDFHRIKVEDITNHLSEIAVKENIEAEKDALHIIAQKADGALRDALSIFDRIVSFSDKKITYDNVIENLNILDYDYYFKLTESLLAEHASETLLIFNEILTNGFEGDDLIIGLSEHFRNILICKDVKTIDLLEVTGNLKQRYKTQASLASASFLISALNIANQCDVNYKLSKNKRLHVELALIKICYINAIFNTSDASHKSSIQSNIKDESKKKMYEPLETKEEGYTTSNLSESENSYNPEKTDNQSSNSNSVPSFKKMMNQPQKEQDAIRVNNEKEALQKEKGNNAASVVNKEIITEAQLTEAWNAYADKKLKEGRNNLYSLMTLFKPKLSGNGTLVEIPVTNIVQQELINEEKIALIEFLEKELNVQDLSIKIIIQKDLENNQKIAYTDKEKFSRMAEKNPFLKQFKQHFDLEIEF